MLERPPIHYPELSLTLSLHSGTSRCRGGGGRGLATLRYMPGPAAAATSSVVRPSTAAAAAPGAEADSNSDEWCGGGNGDPHRAAGGASVLPPPHGVALRRQRHPRLHLYVVLCPLSAPPSFIP